MQTVKLISTDGTIEITLDELARAYAEFTGKPLEWARNYLMTGKGPVKALGLIELTLDPGLSGPDEVKIPARKYYLRSESKTKIPA